MGVDLSEEMKKLLVRTVESGGVDRYPGGFWYPGGDSARKSFGTSTVEALVKRGMLEYSEWKESHGRKFPIKAVATPLGVSSVTAT